MKQEKAQLPEKEPEQNTGQFPATAEAVKKFKAQFKQLVTSAKKQGITFVPEDLELRPTEKLYWVLEDFGPKEEWVEFIPQELPELRNFISENEEGRRFFTLEVNSCRVLLEVGVKNVGPQAFADTYNNLQEQSIANRKFRKQGPDSPLTHSGLHGANTWMAVDAPTAWMDIDGRYIDPNKDYLLYKGVPVPVENFSMLKHGKITGELPVEEFDPASPTPAWLKQAWKKGTTLRKDENGEFKFFKIPQKRKTNADKKVTSTGTK